VCPVLLLVEIASIGIMPSRVEIRLGHSMAAGDVVDLPPAPEDIGHAAVVILKDNHVNPLAAHSMQSAVAAFVPPEWAKPIVAAALKTTQARRR
jgi:hypothetical protein